MLMALAIKTDATTGTHFPLFRSRTLHHRGYHCSHRVNRQRYPPIPHYHPSVQSHTQRLLTQAHLPQPLRWCHPSPPCNHTADVFDADGADDIFRRPVSRDYNECNVLGEIQGGGVDLDVRYGLDVGRAAVEMDG